MILGNKIEVKLEQKKKLDASMWLKVLRQNISQIARRAKGSASVDQKNGSAKSNKSNNNAAEVNRNEDQSGPMDIKSQVKKKSGVAGSGPLLQQAEVSSSQIDFFRMLDEKIENGPDYDESVEVEHVSGLLRQWDLAGMTWSDVSDLRNPSAMSLTSKDRESMRNIIGGRPECAPVITLTANQMDGLEEIHCPSPNMPRHVLESISQSPTQNQTRSALTQLQDLMEDNSNVNRLTRTQANGDFLSQQALYRDQYLQQTGIISVQPQYPSNNIVRNSSYVQQFQITNNSQNYSTSRKRGLNSAQMT